MSGAITEAAIRSTNVPNSPGKMDVQLHLIMKTAHLQQRWGREDL